MSRIKKGFTLIEVALFLVVTGALFVGVTVGVQNSIFQQRFNDSVQNFVEFLRSAYAETMSVVNINQGRSEKAIYGKLITFGESYDLAGNRVNTNDRKNVIFSYDVIGDIGDVETGSVLETLASLDANVVVANDESIGFVGMAESYVPRWAAQIENTNDYNPFEGALLIVRHPRSGTVYTYVMDGETIEINEGVNTVRNQINNENDTINSAQTAIDSYTQIDSQLQSTLLEKKDELNNIDPEDEDAVNALSEEIVQLEAEILSNNNLKESAVKNKSLAEEKKQQIINGMKKNILTDYLTPEKFKIRSVDFCVNPNGDEKTRVRRDVRIVKGARNSTGIEIMPDENSQCLSGV